MDILGIVLTVLFGIVGIFLAWKAIFKAKIQLVFESSTVLANLSKASSDLVVFYKDQDVSNDLVLISCYLINSGNNDIKKSDFEKPVKLLLPENGVWHSFNIKGKSDEISIETLLNNNELVINFGLWKKNEGFYFDALISMENGNNLQEKIIEKIDIKARIHNLYKIEKNRFSASFKKERVKKFIIAFVVNVFLCFYMFVGVGMYFDGLKGKRIYNFYSEKNELVDFSINDKSKIILVDRKTSKQIDNIDDIYKLKPVYETKQKVFDKYLGIILFIASFIALSWFDYKVFSNYRMIKRLNTIKSHT